MLASEPEKNIDVDVNDDGDISAKMAAQLSAIEAEEKGKDEPETAKAKTPKPEKRTPVIHYAGKPNVGPSARTWLERRVQRSRSSAAGARTREDPHAEVRDLCNKIRGAECPTCSAGRLTYSFHPKWYGAPMPYCRKCHREFDLIEIGIVSEKELIQRLKKMGVNVELSDG